MALGYSFFFFYFFHALFKIAAFLIFFLFKGFFWAFHWVFLCVSFTCGDFFLKDDCIWIIMETLKKATNQSVFKYQH